MSIKFRTNKKNGDSSVDLLEVENVSQRGSSTSDCVVSVYDVPSRIYKSNSTGSSTSSDWLSEENAGSHRYSSGRSSTYAQLELEEDVAPRTKSYAASSSSSEYVAVENLTGNKDSKPKVHKKILQNILPMLCLSVPGGEHQRPKSFDGFETERTSCVKQRRTVSRALFELDSGNKGPGTWSIVINRIGRLNTRLLDAIECHNNVEVESMLHAGANPNASCRASHISACHAAAAYGNGDALHLLLKFKAEKIRYDKFGRTPLHLAAWAGKNWTIAMLLGFPIDLQYNVVVRVTPESEEEIQALRDQWSSLINVPCELPLVSAIPETWKDSIEHKCRRFMTILPKFFSGWTPLHIASFAAHHKATRLLLAAGANPNHKDAMGQTPLDIAGAASYLENTRVNADE